VSFISLTLPVLQNAAEPLPKFCSGFLSLIIQKQTCLC
jgi:hypothetical protein